MTRALAGFLVVGSLVVGGVLTNQAVNVERAYRDLLTQGDTAQRDGDTFGAIEKYSGAIALRPDSMLAHLRRGEAYRQRNEFDAAARDFRRASVLDPSAMRPLESLGDVEYQRQWFERAADVYETRLRLDERSSLLWFKLALARYRSGNVDAALTALAQSVRLDDDFPDAHFMMGICYREHGRLKEALAAFEKAVALSPGLIPAREELADVYALLGRRADELEQLQMLAGLDRTNLERQVTVGLAHARAGRGELAVLTLGNALDRNPDQPMIYGALGKVWLDMADTRDDALSKALEALERVASTPQASSDILASYGRALLKAGRNQTAERILQQATRTFPVDPDAFLWYAEAAERLAHHAAARAALIDYEALVVDDADAPLRAERIGRLSLTLNEPGFAVPWFRRASNGDSDPRLLAMLADAQLRSSDMDGARATIAAALEKHPGNAALLAVARRARQ
jgi:tetratricopeptide (TPR) repeat protein